MRWLFGSCLDFGEGVAEIICTFFLFFFFFFLAQLLSGDLQRSVDGEIKLNR